MEENWIFEDIYELTTPVGVFSVTDGRKNVMFSVKKSSYGMPYDVVDEDNNIIGNISTDTSYVIIISTDELEIGKEYRISFSAGNWYYCDSDERTTCYYTVIGEWMVGIGACDPMDDNKLEQAIKYTIKNTHQDPNKARCIHEPDKYDESDFKYYTVYPLYENNGYMFKLFDREAESVCFDVCWIKIDEYDEEEYESAVGFWLT